MKNVQKIDLGLTGYDELFMNDAERKENKLPRIYDVPISEIDDFPDHPFKVKVDEDTIKASNPYDDLEMSGSRAVWPEVLSVYAVKTTNDPDNPQEVASATEEKKQLLTDIY